MPFVIDGVLNIAAGLGLAGALWIGITTLHSLYQRVRVSKRLPLAFSGMILAHLGMSMFIAGVTMVMTYSLEKDVRGSGRVIDQVCPRAACLRGPSICYQWNRRLLQMTPRTGPAAKSSTGVVPLPEWDVIARSALPSPRGGRHRPDGVNPIPDVGTGTFRCPERIDASSEGYANRLSPSQPGVGNGSIRRIQRNDDAPACTG